MRNTVGRMAALLLASALGSGCLSHSLSVRDTLEETRPLDARGRFELENTNGRVELETWDRDEVRIFAELRASSERRLAQIEVRIEGEGDRVRVETRLPGSSFLGGGAEVAYHVTVPRTARVELGSVNGRLSLTGVEGVVKASTVNGRIELEGAPSEVEASTVNGRIEASYHTPAGSGRHRFSTTNGRVTVCLPGDANGRFEVSTVNGRIRSDLPLEVEGRRRQRIRDRIGEGGADYSMETVNGSVRICRL
jgi:hypothetical protein